MENDSKAKILAFSGSTRKDSLNRKLLSAAAKSIKDAGGVVTIFEFRDFPMPFYDEDLQKKEGFSQNVKKFRSLVKSHNGFLIATPEYNHGISAVLKNAIDWASRREGKEPPGSLFRDKPGLIISAAPGGYGGVRALMHLREVLGALGIIVLPGQLALSRANKAFEENGSLSEPLIEAEIAGLTQSLVKLSRTLR
jgi:NAD(P)H-dependent FMN reductase